MNKEWELIFADLKTKIKVLNSKTNTLKKWVNELEQDLEQIKKVLGE